MTPPPFNTSSPVAAAQQHQLVGLLREGAKGDAGSQVAQVGSVQEAFGGCKANKQTVSD